MSNEIRVLFNGKLPNKAALTRCFKELGFPLSFHRGTGALEPHGGYLPMRLHGQESGVEFIIRRGREDRENVAKQSLGRPVDCRIDLRWGGDESELTVALCLAAAAAKLLDGLVLDESEEEPRSADAAIDAARKQLEASAVKVRPHLAGTRPADIKRYLKPLLQNNSELALVGRFLMIRPIRHLLRGAFLDRTSDKYRFRVARRCTALFDKDGSGADGELHAGAFATWQPHFVPLLMASLDEDVFARVGHIVTLTDFAAQKPARPWFAFSQITSLVLAGEFDRAEALVVAVERGEASDEQRVRRIRTHWENLTRDIESTCAQAHANEAETVKELGIEQIWEPSLFPVELPTAERTKAAEPLFSTARWPARPSWLWQEPPKAPGEVRYAKKWLRRDDDPHLLVALTTQQAEERHREHEDYVSAVRLVDDSLLIIDYISGRDRNAPLRAHSDILRYWSLNIVLRGASRWIHALASSHFGDPGQVEITSMTVHQPRASDPLWSCALDRVKATKRVRDYRGARTIQSETPLIADERSLRTFLMPAFGRYTIFPERLHALLHAAGYGDAV